ncbi:DUF6461 domain-containing protein [Dactylosporangium sp. McL0621]|uniref:DUF6461 domain-containing protein n=1 Tax=Dactylosporangium sp. McL0621 TaxID=3415678 RepID=UPI003CEAABB2
MTDGLERAVELCEALGEIFCLTFVRGLDAREALTRMGAYPDTFAELSPEEMYERQSSFDAGYPSLAGAVTRDGWTVCLEPDGFECAGPLLATVSHGTEAVSVLRHDYASPRFTYAVDGEEVTGFDPGYPHEFWGTDPGRLTAQLHAVGLGPIAPADEGPDEPVARAVLLAATIAGGLPSPDALTGPMLSAQFDPWFTAARPSGGSLSPDPFGQRPQRAELVAAVDAASPEAKRAVAVAEARRIAGLLRVADAPGLADTLAAAEAGRFPGVPVASPLGREVRGWLRYATTAGQSLNDHAGQRMTDADRQRGYLFGWFTLALRGALYPDPDIAVRTALYPLSTGPAPLTDPAAHAAVVAGLAR